ncbi:E3 ubiquitin-protein ligase TM129 isoform 2-T2 [Molossus nigricans]
MCFAASEKRLYSPSQVPEAWRFFLLLAVTLPTITCTLIYYWSWDRWARHPLARTLALYALPQSGWQAVASSVNTEFRRIDKFATGAPGARVIVTDTWVMKVTTYRVHVAQQQDVHLTVTESQQHELSPDSNLPVQLLTIRVASTNPWVQAFDIRLNSTEYGELCEKLRAPIRSAANVVIRQSLGAGGMHWLHADTCQCEAGEDLPGGGRGRVPAVLLPPYVVSHLHGQVVCQPPGPTAPRHLAGQPCALPHLPCTLLHPGCVRRALSRPGHGEGAALGVLPALPGPPLLPRAAGSPGPGPSPSYRRTKAFV